MIYIASYLFIGLVLVTVKSPIRKLVDSEIRKIEFHNAFGDENVSTLKMLLLRIILSIALIIIYPLMLFSEFKEKREKRITKKEEFKAIEDARRKWLQSEISIEEAEAKYLVQIKNQAVPFGYMNSAWIRLLKKMQEGDTLHEYQPSDGSPEQLTGREGIALNRNGKIVADLAIRLN